MTYAKLGLALCAVLMPGIGWTQTAQAQTQTEPADVDLTPIVVTATRIPTPATDVAAGVTVIGQQEIAARGYTTLAQALDAVPGVTVMQSGGPGEQASVFIRGTNSEDVLVLVDGVPVNDPSDPNGAFDFGQDTLVGVDHVEVVRGPLSGLYGSSAIGGVINIQTIQGYGKPTANLIAAGGFPGQGLGQATLSGSDGKFDYALSGEVNEQAGFDATAQRLSVYDGNRDPYRDKSAAAQFGYTVVPGTRVYAIGRARDTDTTYPDLGYPVFDDPDESDRNKNLFGKLGVKSQLTQAWNSELFIARVVDDRQYLNLLDGDDPNYASADDHYHGARTDAQFNNVVTLPDAGPSAAAAVQFGAEYIDDTARERVDESGFLEDVAASQHSVSGHAGGQTTLYDRLTLTGSVRDDGVSSFGNAFTGRVGGVLAIPEADLRLKSSFGTGFLAPSLYELYGVDNAGYQGDPDLKPERSSGYDAGVVFDLPAASTLSVSYFDNDIRDLITPTDDFSTEENVGRSKIDGVETELVLAPVPWAQADLTYTYTDAIDQDTNTQLLRRPRHTGSATFTFKPLPRLSIVPEVRYVGAFTDYLYGDDGYPEGDGLAKPGTIFDLTVDYRLTPKLTLFAQGKNLSNSKFEPVNGTQIPGASLLLGVSATIN